MLQPTLSYHRSHRARAAAHRAMAIAALASNSSTRVRYRRYHAHMHKAAALLSYAQHYEASSLQEVTK